jgi:hypothetical protein
VDEPVVLPALDAYRAYALLVPEGASLFNAEASDGENLSTISATLALGGMAFDVPPTPTPTETPVPSSPCDFDGDGDVDRIDLLTLLRAMDPEDPAYDLTGDNHVDQDDVMAFCREWNP